MYDPPNRSLEPPLQDKNCNVSIPERGWKMAKNVDLSNFHHLELDDLHILCKMMSSTGANDLYDIHSNEPAKWGNCVSRRQFCIRNEKARKCKFSIRKSLLLAGNSAMSTLWVVKVFIISCLGNCWLPTLLLSLWAETFQLFL